MFTVKEFRVLKVHITASTDLLIYVSNGFSTTTISLNGTVHYLSPLHDMIASIIYESLLLVAQSYIKLFSLPLKAIWIRSANFWDGNHMYLVIWQLCTVQIWFTSYSICMELIQCSKYYTKAAMNRRHLVPDKTPNTVTRHNTDFSS